MAGGLINFDEVPRDLSGVRNRKLPPVEPLLQDSDFDADKPRREDKRRQDETDRFFAKLASWFSVDEPAKPTRAKALIGTQPQDGTMRTDAAPLKRFPDGAKAGRTIKTPTTTIVPIVKSLPAARRLPSWELFFTEPKPSRFPDWRPA